MASIDEGNESPVVKPRVVSIGLVADPELPTEIAKDLAEQLPELLRDRIDAQTGWVVSVRREPLPVHQRPRGLIEAISRLLESEDWDLSICLTDLPLQVDGRSVVAEASLDRHVGFISLPALGPAQAHERTRDVIVRLVEELLAEGEQSAEAARRAVSTGTVSHSDVRRDVDGSRVRFVAAPWRGTGRLLAGMVRANRPWRLVLGLLSSLTAAVATSALANLNVTVWRVASALGTPRLIVLTVASLGGMVVWLLVIHKLWRRPSAHMTQRQATLFNLTTVFTLLIGVATLYAGLFVFNLITGLLVVASGPLRGALGHPAEVADYVRLAWFVSSVATVGGALGSGLESNAAVRAAAYRYQAEESEG
jgi:hypothetical protein